MSENPLSPFPSPFHSSNSVSSFPIIAISVIGICATAFFLVSYYIFVIKCCLNWHPFQILTRFSPHQHPQTHHSPPETRGLDASLIRSIPLIQYKKPTSSFNCECAVCLSEFEEDQQLRKIPNCSHLFHIDCIDIWLQNHSNCPVCRCCISSNEDFVVIELGGHHEPPPEPRKLRTPKYGRNLKKMRSVDDESIDMRHEDDQFTVQPIRRSFSMDSSGDRQLYLAVQEALQQNRQQHDQYAVCISPIEGCSSSSSSSARVGKSFFSFGHDRRSKTAVILGT